MKNPLMRTQFSTLCILLILTNTSAQRDDFTPTPQEIDQIFFFSSASPISRAINRIAPSVAQHVQVILSHIDFLEKQILTSLANGKQLKPDKISLLCTTADQVLNNSIFRSFGLRGLPDPDRACITEVQAEGDSLTENAPHSVDELYNAITERGIILNQNMKAIASRFVNVEGNFTGAETPHGFVYNRKDTRCILHSACGIREGPDWRLATPIHSRPKYESLPDFGRQVINEYTRAVNGRLEDPLRMRLQEFRIDDLPREIRARTTTYIMRTSGNAHPDCFRRDPIPQNPAVLNALSKVDQDLTHAEDAVKPSNVAILVFPLGFNLVPIGLLADVNRMSLLLYMLLTDVLTCLPLLMKGIELISMHQTPNRAFTVRVSTALNGTRSETASAEMWGAECRAPGQIRQIGIAFTVLAVVLMLGGMVGEVIARRFAKEHKRRATEAVCGSKGPMLGVWADQDATEEPKEELQVADVEEDVRERSVTFRDGTKLE